MPLDLEVVASSGDRPLPTRDAFSAPFWDAAQRHELRLQKCSDCETFRFYPRPMCPQCHSLRASWSACSGRGTIYSFTVVRRPLARWFREHVPLICAIIELAEGPRMMSNVVGVDPENVRIGIPVHIAYEDVNDEITLPYFITNASDDARE